MNDTAKTKKDCFAYKETKCNALNKRYCDFENCNFYKQKEAKAETFCCRRSDSK